MKIVKCMLLIITLVILCSPVVGESLLSTSDFGGVLEVKIPAVPGLLSTSDFGGVMEVKVNYNYSKNISNDGRDYFCWKGDGGNLSDVAAVISNFDEDTEFVAVWNDTSWTTNEGCWIKYYGDGSGNGSAVVNQLDVIYCYLEDSGKQTIYMETTTPVDCNRTVDLQFLGSDVNKGYNYTCYCCNIAGLQDLSDIAADINLADGEVVAWWDNNTQTWYNWIEGVSHTDYDVTIDVESPIFETKVHTNYSWVISCP